MTLTVVGIDPKNGSSEAVMGSISPDDGGVGVFGGGNGDRGQPEFGPKIWERRLRHQLSAANRVCRWSRSEVSTMAVTMVVTGRTIGSAQPELAPNNGGRKASNARRWKFRQ